MKKFCYVLALLLVISHPPHTASADPPVFARLVMPIFFAAKIPSDIDLICERVDAIAKEKIGASVELIPLLYLYGAADPLRVAELEMLAKQGINLDIYPSVISEYVEPIILDDLLEQYGQDIQTLIGEFRLSYARASGPLYQLSALNDYVSSVGLTMRKDIIDKYDIDLSNIQTLFDLDELYLYVSQLEPDLRMVAPYQTHYSLLSRYKYMLAVSSSFFAVSQEDTARLENYYATDAYRESLELVRKWYEAGYLPKNLALQNISASQLVGAGELFSYICAYKPGIDFEESQSCGMSMVTISLAQPLVTSRSLSTTKWGISSTCINPGKAMQFLNLLYTDNELVNLLMYGIEGMHYVVLEDGTIDYPEGITAETVGYQNTLSWILPNQTVAHVWHGNDPDLWATLLAHNESAPISDTLTFVFDDSSIASEYAKVNAIVNKYAYGLETGQLDPAIYLPMLLEEMEAEGATRIIEEGQAQFDVYLSGKEGTE